MANEQKFALITGATSGIGYELAKLLAQDKYNLVLVARHQQELDRTAAEFQQQYGVQVVPLAKDLFQREAPFELYEAVRAQGIEVEVLVNDAGQGQYGEFIETDINRELDIIQLNIGAYVVLTKCFLKEMVARGSGKILQVSSIGGELPGPLQSVYHGTKAFVTSFTEAIREETKDSGVTITALLPGVTDTDFFRKADMEQSKLVAEGSKADPADVAKDGYEALLAGKDKIVSGFKNKVQVAISNVLPDDLVAANMHQQGKPVDDDSK
ncbi:SDR family NAD(P)-dependent oxidoreductase [Hymenobacter cellulosivorans]|uniref:SDR family oxidoreductase n=1 Tax=Hymenobacter cellulosivorans TaxID=2932249 RepID=A0ABY4F6N7_9BACT|nr:SDR family oxidoreductase [Hymenobacter cellulosivorans]UOQ52327.1 SDR family oxidoreductase [Hymenobacter cellulosivorans]